MCRALFALLCAFAASPARADDDGWTGGWVFPKTNGVPLRDKDGKELMKWSVSAGKVIGAGKDSVMIRHSQAPGRCDGYAMKTEVVKLADATRFFTDKIQENEKDAWAWMRRAEAWTLKGEHEHAIEDLTEAIRLDPQAQRYMGRGVAWRAKKDYDKAIKDFTEAIRLDPKDATAFCNRGIAWGDKEEYDKAIKDYTEAIRLDPKDATAFYNRGIAWGDKEEYDKAIKDYTEAIRLDPKDATAFYNRGVAWQEKRNYENALADYTEATRLDPEDAWGWHAVAWLLTLCPEAKLRDGRRAVQAATKACELTNWKSAVIVDILAAAYAETGDFEKAIKYQKLALEDRTFEKENGESGRKRLRLYEMRKPYRLPPEKK